MEDSTPLDGQRPTIFCMIEQDLYPVEPDVPLPISARTAGYSPAAGSAPYVGGRTAGPEPPAATADTQTGYEASLASEAAQA